ncbi:MAG: hypothetical protein PGN21_01800 [Sphingomonas paucimobilis]
MRKFLWLATLGWLGLILLSYRVTISPALIGAAIGGTVAIGVLVSNRHQARRQLALDLHREYYSHAFSKTRRRALWFFRRHAGVDWSRVNPIDLADPDDTRDAYFEVLRFWQRVATLYEAGAIHEGLSQQLLSRELGIWFATALEETTKREGLYVGAQIRRLREAFAIGEGVVAYREGLREGAFMRPRSVRVKWAWNGWRWSSRGRLARDPVPGPPRRKH